MAIDPTVRVFAGAVNTYPSSPLRGCIADAEAMLKLFERHGRWPAEGRRLQFNDHMRNADVREAAEWMVADPGVRRSLMILSGHGARRPRPVSGRADSTEEFYCPHDVDRLWSSPDLANDAFLEGTFARAPRGGKHIYFAFCCHSGGVSNASVDDAAAAVMREPGARPKYLRGPFEEIFARERPEGSPRAFRRAGENVFVDNDCDYVWFAAARSDQYSYEVAGPDGSFDVSRKALETIIAAKPNVTVRQAHRAAVEWIRDTYGFDQTPQVWGPDRLLDSDFFS
jgi:hypothetical protein